MRTVARKRSVIQSDASEDLIERIAELVSRKGYARATDLAEALGVATSTISNAVQRLSRKGLLNYEKYRGFTLTAAGQEIADQIALRHETLTEFFTLLGLPEETVNAEVEDIEHHLRPETLVRLTAVVSYWKTHPREVKVMLSAKSRKGGN